LAHGQWLGPFDQFTMIKGPGYPAFIALMYRSGVPLKIGEQLTYLLAIAAVAGCVWVVTRRRATAFAAYAVLIFDPVNFGVHGARIDRDSWYASLSMLFVAAFFLAVYHAVTGVRLRRLVVVSVLAGVAGAAFWLCREEGLWILPSILLIAFGIPIVPLVRWWFRKPRTDARSQALRTSGRLGLVLAVVGVGIFAPVATVSAENSGHYGAALTNDLASGQFARAYADWRRVKAGTPSAATPLVRPQRDAVYQVSSAARELEPYLEDPNSSWIRDSCRILNPPCGEIAGVLVVFALRDSSASAGHFHSEADAQSFFGELDTQIEAACESGQLSCMPRLPTELQSVQYLSTGPLLTYLRHWIGVTLASTGFDSPPIRHWPLGASRSLFAQIVPGVPASQSAADAQVSRFAANDWEYRLLIGIYRLLLPVLLAAALIGLVFSIVRPRWPQVALSVLSCALVIGALSRLLLVALLNTTLFPTKGSDIRYLLPTHAFLMAFAVVGTAQFADTLWTRSRLGRGDQPSERVVPSMASEAS
jgi:hypothetical protein